MVQVPMTMHSNKKGSPDDVPALATLHRAPGGPAKVAVQLRLPPDVARSFKVWCAERDLELSEAFQRMFEEHRARNP